MDKDIYSVAVLDSFYRMLTDEESYILMLMEPGHKLQIPVVIDAHAVALITLAATNTSTALPMPHGLITSLCDTFHLDIEKVTVDRYDLGIYYCHLHVHDGVCTHRLPCRISDAVTLALHKGVPILLHHSVVEAVGVHNADEALAMPTEAPTVPPTAAEMEQTFLSNLEQALQDCLQKEDYEQAAKLSEQIEQLKKKSQ